MLKIKSAAVPKKETETVRITEKVKSRANAALAPFLSGSPMREIPLGDMFATLKNLGIVVVQEDNTPWSGIISAPTEQDTRMTFDLSWQDEVKGLVPISNSQLVLSIYKFATGTYEVTGYVA